MSQLIATLPLRTEADVVAARLDARRIGEQLGFDRRSQTRMATAVSEIARNAFAYGEAGQIEFRVDLAPRAERFSAVVSDRGPGMADLDAILSGQKVFPAGYGNGIVSARRLVDDFDISSSPGGTRVELMQRIPRALAQKLTPASVRALAQAPRPTQADPASELRERNRELVESLSDLHDRQAEAVRLNRELEETNRGVVALYSELDERAEQLRNVSDLKSRFLSHMSHEFRTPLNSILALSRLLADGVDGVLNSEQQRQVDYIRGSAQGLLEMVNDLLDLAKVEAGKLDVKPVLFSVADLFTGLRGSLKPLLAKASVDLIFDEPAGLPDLFADEPKVAQVLRNFISNALKFTESGSVRVSAHYDREQERIVFKVVDTGVGIAPESLQYIFEEFSQLDGRLQQGGTGLGLPLSRRLATLMGGTIDVDSRLDTGSTFRLVLPVRFGQAQVAPRRSGDAAAPQLLVVDDEEAFRYVVRHIAEDAGCVVTEAKDGAAGLQMIRELHPDLVILDLQMPKMDGFVVLAELAASGTADIPIIVCSAQTLTLEQKRSLSGSYAIVPKHDISRDGLTALIQGVLRRPEEPA